MKPFDLNKALAGEKVVTRDGREVKQIFYFDKSDEKYPVYALFHKYVEQYTTCGRYNSDHKTEYDLFMSPKTEKLTIYVSKHKNANGLYQTTYAIPEGTLAHDDDDPVKIMRKVEVEIEVGE